MDLIKLLQDHGYMVAHVDNIDGELFVFKAGQPAFHGTLEQIVLQHLAFDTSLYRGWCEAMQAAMAAL